VLSEFSSRVELLGSVYGEQQEAKTGLNRIYNAAVHYLDGREDRFIKLPQVERVMRLMEAIQRSSDTKQVIAFE